ncbi:MAG TPA: YciI family protein [Ideonella sp.]|nr:YciI family protein [Ideonella sp.]
MSYMLLIMEPTGQRVERGVEAGRQVYDRMLKFTDDLQAKGVLVASNSLASTTQAVRLQLREGRRTLVDGPFTEAKEMVGGFFLLNCATRAEAVAIASECPAAEWATVEIRRVGPCYEPDL